MKKFIETVPGLKRPRAPEEFLKEKGLPEPKQIRNVTAPALEVHLKSRYQKIGEESLQDAENSARRMRPKEHGDKLSSYVMHLVTLFEECGRHIHTRLNTTGLERIKEQVTEAAAEEIKVIQEEKARVDNEVRNSERDLKSLLAKVVAPVLASLYVTAIVMILLSTDVVYNINAFQAMGFNFIKSFLISFGVVVSLAIAGYFLFEELRKDETMKKSTAKIVGLSLVIVGCFVGISYMRINFLNEMGGQAVSPVFGTLAFVLINILIFGATSVIFHKFYPTKEERKLQKDISAMKKLLGKLKAQYRQLVEDEGIIRTRSKELVRETDDLIDYANHMLKENIAYYRKVVAVWMKETSSRLPYMPDCMEQEIPELKTEFVIRKRVNGEKVTGDE